MHVEACFMRSEDIDGLASGTLDHNESFTSMCVCAFASYTSFPGDPECVWSAEFFCHFLLLFFCMLRLSSVTQLWTVWHYFCPLLTDGRERDGGGGLQFPLLCALHSCSPPMPFDPPIHSLFTTPSLPSPLHCTLLSLDQWSTNATCSAASCSKKPLSVLGTTESGTDTNGKGINSCCFLPSGLAGGSFIVKWESHQCINKTHTTHMHTQSKTA